MYFFFFNDTAPTEIYTLSLHDALPISASPARRRVRRGPGPGAGGTVFRRGGAACRRDAARPLRPDARGRRHRARQRSEEHTSELQSQSNLVCRLLLEKKNT